MIYYTMYMYTICWIVIIIYKETQHIDFIIYNMIHMLYIMNKNYLYLEYKWK